MLKTAVRRVGNSLGVTLPKTVLEACHLDEGDELNIVQTDGGFFLTPFDPELTEWIKAYEEANKQYRNTFRALAR